MIGKSENEVSHNIVNYNVVIKEKRPYKALSCGRGTRTLRLAFGHLTLCASLSLGGAPLTLKAQKLLCFLCDFESFRNQSKKTTLLGGLFVWQGH